MPLLLLLYFLAKDKWRNGILLTASILFYAWGAPDYVLILIATTIAIFYLVRKMSHMQGAGRKAVCIMSCFFSLAFLAFFKYSNFFIDNLNHLFGLIGVMPMAWVYVALPIGISFYTFQSITYIVDVYRGDKPMNRLTDYMLYIMMFPQLIAGPIVRYGDIAEQICTARHTSWDSCIQGFCRFAIGLSKKVLIADVLGRVVDVALGGDIGGLGMWQAWVVLVAYTMQLYFDFSGYSDMAIGLGRIFGFSFSENFNNPYISASISEFWRRWHISLGTFMMNYLYVPLGGNRRGKGRTFVNLWIVFLLSGIWHGAGWNFVLWGAYHGFFIATEKLLGIGKRKDENTVI